MEKINRLRFETIRRGHLEYLKRCWEDSVEFAEGEVGHKSDDPADRDVRQAAVFDLSQHVFLRHTLDFADFLELSLKTGKKRRRTS